MSILGIKINTVAQTASISMERKDKLIELCNDLLAKKTATLLDMQQVAGHLQFVVQIAPHGKAFLQQLYDAVRSRYKQPHHQQQLDKSTCKELEWWHSTLSTWNGVTLLQSSPLLVCHIWTDACPRGLGAHEGSAELPTNIFLKDVSQRH